MLAGICAGVACAMLSALIVWRGMAFVGDAIAHSILPGIVVAFVVGFSLFLGALAAAIVASIAIGKRTQLTSPAAPGVMAIGEVTAINPQINRNNRAIEVTVEFDNPGGWLPGASVDATVIIEQHPGALTLPATSVVTRSDQEVVFVVEGDHVRARPVMLGWQEVDWVEITSGLNPEDRVVINGAALISDGSLVTER